MTFSVEAYREEDRDQVLALSLRAWAPVFDKLEPAVPAYIYRAFYPQGWEPRQASDIADLLSSEREQILVARAGGDVLGWVGLRLHPKDSMGEIYILAVDPSAQRQGVARALMEAGLDRIRQAGMVMAMVETGGDPGHAASRATYEALGFDRWPVARYFRQL